MQLTKNFSLEELTHSDIAIQHGLENIPDDATIENLRQLCIFVLQPMREALGPIHVNGAFRSEAVNRAAGGVSTSDHLFGRAADVKPMNCSLYEGMVWLMRNAPCYQAILEADTWLHVAYRAGATTPKRWLRGFRQSGLMAYGPFVP